MPLDQKIVIIGAGPTGLGAAEALREAGYRRVQILEKRDRPGGQACSRKLEYLGTQYSYDLGSGQPFGSKILSKLIGRYHLPMGREYASGEPILIRSVTTGSEPYADFERYRLGYPVAGKGLLRDFFQFKRLIKGNHKAMNRLLGDAERGLQDLTKQAEDYLVEFRWNVLDRDLKQILRVVTAGGEGSCYPATFEFLRRCMEHPSRYINGRFHPVNEGYQSIWNRCAQTHEVVYRQQVTKIERSPTKRRVITSERDFEFDKLIVACPLNRLPVDSLLPWEREWSQHYMNSPAVRASALVKGSISSLHLFSDIISHRHTEANQPYGIVPENRLGSDLTLCTVLSRYSANQAFDVATFKRNAEDAVRWAKLGEVLEWIDVKTWPEYSGRFSREALGKGILGKIEARQGCRDTYYGGEAISGKSHGACVDHAYRVVADYFV